MTQSPASPSTEGPRDGDSDGIYSFDAAAADKAQGFFERCLVHSKGHHARKPFILQPWQRDRVIRPFFGWKRPDGTRRYRDLWLEIPRKNGKSTLMAGFALYALLADGEPGAEVYGCAADREQAKIVFKEARSMRDLNPKIASETTATKDAILWNDQGIWSTYRVLSSDAATKHGLNPSGFVFDEVHAQPNAELYEVMSSAVGARRQPIMAYGTTAGHDTLSICYELHDRAERAMKGELEAPDLLPVIYAADAEDDPFDPATWAKANPSLGTTVLLEYLANEAKKARSSPRAENTFKRLHLDLWTEQAVRWLSVSSWRACDGKPIDERSLYGRKCYGGLDLGATQDTTGWVLVFPPRNGAETWTILFRCFLPDAGLKDRIERDRVPYSLWAEAGWLTLTPGPVTDYDLVLAKVKEDARVFDLQEVGYDRWGSAQVVKDLTDANIKVQPVGQGYGSLSEPMKQLERLILSQKISHGGNPVATWQFGNIAAIEDENKNIKPAKARSRGRIDLFAAVLDALNRAGVPAEDVKIPGIAVI